MDDRVRKIVGFTILALATFLGFAFISYLFTWKTDQAAAMSYGWSLIFSDVAVANWMGPLGASVSHMAFYAGFGATSFLGVYLLALVGIAILKRRPLVQLQRQLRWGLFGLLVLSVMLAFLFQMIDFPMASWLERMIGIPGVVLLIALALVMLVIWIFDPSWNDVTSGKILNNGAELVPALPSGLSKFVGRFTSEKAKPARKPKVSEAASKRSGRSGL